MLKYEEEILHNTLYTARMSRYQQGKKKYPHSKNHWKIFRTVFEQKLKKKIEKIDKKRKKLEKFGEKICKKSIKIEKSIKNEKSIKELENR